MRKEQDLLAYLNVLMWQPRLVLNGASKTRSLEYLASKKLESFLAAQVRRSLQVRRSSSLQLRPNPRQPKTQFPWQGSPLLPRD